MQYLVRRNERWRPLGRGRQLAQTWKGSDLRRRSAGRARDCPGDLLIDRDQLGRTRREEEVAIRTGRHQLQQVLAALGCAQRDGEDDSTLLLGECGLLENGVLGRAVVLAVGDEYDHLREFLPVVCSVEFFPGLLKTKVDTSPCRQNCASQGATHSVSIVRQWLPQRGASGERYQPDAIGLGNHRREHFHRQAELLGAIAFHAR